MRAELQLIEPNWPAPAGIRAAFTLRTGGVSTGPYSSLNLGAAIGDAPLSVEENRRRVREALSLPCEPAWLEQVHGCDVVDITSAASLRGDAAVAGRGGSVCAIRVADCMPVLFCSRDGSVVGAAHAGWRGMAGGVLEATVQRLGAPASQLLAWMGPAIGPEHFEVGDDVRQAFIGKDPSAQSAFAPNARGRWQCDLYSLARRRLTSIGVMEVHGGGWCTYSEPQRFFSHRRDGPSGRMAAFIWNAR